MLRHTRDFPIAVVEAKADYKKPGDGLGQAKDYAEALGLRFAYSTNGHGIVEFDYTLGRETEIAEFPSPDELWQRLSKVDLLTDAQSKQLLEGCYIQPGMVPRYYQEIAINRVVQAIVQGERRVLVTMATGTGKTTVAFQICWKLWNAKWNLKKATRRPRILYLADRNILIDDPKEKDFFPFGDARHKIENGKVIKSREMYFAIYQAIARDERRPGLYKEYAPDFFDLVIIDECHRDSALADSSWREILDYFQPAAQFGMTATPLRNDNRATFFSAMSLLGKVRSLLLVPMQGGELDRIGSLLAFQIWKSQRQNTCGSIFSHRRVYRKLVMPRQEEQGVTELLA